MRLAVTEYIRNCATCQRCKADLAAYPGLLQPLPVPGAIWEDIAMDFIEGLPLSNRHSVILVVIDRLSKYAHFLALQHPFSAVDVAQVFLDNVFKLHGFPKSITSDRDKVFISTFWQELLAIHGIDQNLSTAYHPQSDGQSEVLNRCLEGYLRCMCFAKPNDWHKWLPLAEFWYNTNFHSAIRTTPYEVVYGQPPPLHLPYLPNESKVETVDRSLRAREDTITLLKHNLAMARNRMKQLADKHRSERTFNVGDWVYLKLQPYKQSSVEFRQNQKLAAKFFGPYQIIAKVGSVAYTLQLPAKAAIHPTFHVSQLKKHHGPSAPSTDLPDSHTQVVKDSPSKVLEIRTSKRHNRMYVEWLVQWRDSGREDATWESAEKIMCDHPRFDPWGQGSSQPGGIDTHLGCMDLGSTAKERNTTLETRG